MPELMTYVGPVLQGSIALLVFAIGLRTTWGDVRYLPRHPGLLARSILARNVIVPMAALFLCKAFALEAPVAAALLAVSIAAVPPILPRSLQKAGGGDQYPIGLVVTQSVLAVILVPLSLAVFNAVLGLDARFTPAQVWPLVAKLTLAPLSIGLVLRRLAPSFADRVTQPLHTIATLLLVGALVVILPVAWRAWGTLVGNGTLVAMMVMGGIALAAGHFLGGPREQDRTSLALASVSSNPGLAAGILSANMVAQHRLAIAAVLLYLVVQALVSIPYKRAHKPAPTSGLYRIGERRSVPRPGPDRRRAVG